MHAFLITGESRENRQQALEKLLVDQIVDPNNRSVFPGDEKQAYGIEMIRDIIGYLGVRTTAKGTPRAIIINNAHLLTLPAQHAFLKTLEESTPDTIIILTADRDDLLLPTIRSRCLIITTTAEPHAIDIDQQQKLFTRLSGAGMGERVQFAQDMGKTREQALEFVEGQLILLHQQLHSQGIKHHQLRSLLSAYYDLSHNVNPKMVLFELIKSY